MSKIVVREVGGSNTLLARRFYSLKVPLAYALL